MNLNNKAQNQSQMKIKTNMMIIFIGSLFFSSCLLTNQNCVLDKYDDKVYIKVDTMPIFNDKDGYSIPTFVIYQLSNKSFAQFPGGRVVLELIINKQGRVSKASIYGKNKEEYSELENIVVDMFVKKSTWLPGKCGKRKVNTKIYLPIHLSFQ